MSNTAEHRRRAATAGRQYLAKEISWDAFTDQFGEAEDDLIAELVDLIEHEPKRGGFLGVSEKDWADYRDQVVKAIEALEQESVA